MDYDKMAASGAILWRRKSIVEQKEIKSILNSPCKVNHCNQRQHAVTEHAVSKQRYFLICIGMLQLLEYLVMLMKLGEWNSTSKIKRDHGQTILIIFKCTMYG